MKRRPAYRHPLVDVGLVLGLVALVVASASRGSSSSTTFSAALEQNRTPLQRRSGAPPRPKEEPAPGAIRVRGTERVQWEQPGTSLEQVRQWRYVTVVGLARREMKGVKCDAPKGPAGPFVCSGILPALDQGNHQLRIVAIREEGGRELASPWSRPILVFKESATIE